MTFVYFLRPVGKTGPIKIGASVKPGERAVRMATFGAEPLDVLVTIPGDLALERNLHECFLDCHSHREWFFPIPRLVAAIEALQAGVPVERAVDLSKRLGSFKNAKRHEQHSSNAQKERYALGRRQRRIAKGKHWPADLDALMIHPMRHVPLTDAQRARFDEALADPDKHMLTREEYVPAVIAYREWLATAPSQAEAA
jgi:hypothetical protein